MTPGAAPFESLDYVYIPAPDFEGAVHFYTAAFGGELRWRNHDAGTWVGAVRVSPDGPVVLIANHLEPGHAVLIYRVAKLDDVRRRLEREGFTAEGQAFEIPTGPCLVFRDPGGQRLAVYERVRPGVERSFEGRFDTV
jgi:predicted enzyme related to lactoylglutathione lyase